MRKLISAAAISLALLVSACGASNPAPATSPGVSPSPVETAATPTRQPTSTPACTNPAKPGDLRVEDWPDPSRYETSLISAFPWDVQGFPDNIPNYPEFELSDGLEIPEHIPGDEPVTFKLELHNRYDETVSFGLRGDPAYDFVVSNMEGEVVWLYSDNVEVEPGEDSIELEPGERSEWAATWDLTGPDGERVEDGLYAVAAIIFRQQVYVELEEQYIHIGEMSTLEESFDVRLSAPSEAQCGESVTLTLEVTNVTDQIVKVFTGHNVDDFVAFASGDAEREEIWKWWHDKVVLLYGREAWIPPGETATFIRTWELQDLDGGHVPPGAYELQASFRGSRIVNTSGDDGLEEKLWSNIVEITVTE